MSSFVFFNTHIIEMKLVQHLLLQLLRYDYIPALHDHTIYNC